MSSLGQLLQPRHGPAQVGNDYAPTDDQSDGEDLLKLAFPSSWCRVRPGS